MPRRSTDFRPRHGLAATPDELTEQARLFAATIRAAPREKLRPATSADWGPREILCHLVFWHAQYVGIIEALLANREPVLLTGSFKWHNAEAIRQLSGCGVEELLRRLEASQGELDRIARRKDVEQLSSSFRQGSERRSFAEFVDVIANHFRSHRLQVERLIGRGFGSRRKSGVLSREP